MTQVYENIRKIRELSGLTREFVASELNMSPSGYGKIERGEVDLTISRLFQIAEVFNVSPGSLIFLDISLVIKSHMQNS